MSRLAGPVAALAVVAALIAPRAGTSVLSSCEAGTPLCITGTKYEDTNGDGSLDANETGLPKWGVVVYRDKNTNGVLDSGDEQFVPTQSTADDGSYAIRVKDVQLIVCEQLALQRREFAEDWKQSEPGGDLCGANGGGYLLRVSRESDLSGTDFGNFRHATLTGHVYADANQNGTFDGGEQGLAATVLAYRGEQLVQTVQTDEQGAYSLTLDPGSYNVCARVGERWRPEVQLPVTCADGSRGYSTELVSGGATRLDFPNLMIVSAAKITGHVYADANQNGTFDGGEQGLAATVLAYRGEQLVQTVQTDEQGAYSLTLDPGSYNVCARVGERWRPEVQLPVTCADGSRGYSTELVSGGATRLDFPNLMIVSAAKITGHVYADANQNGTFDGGEQGLAATVLAYRGEQLVQTVQTDEQGAYSLTLDPGSYNVCARVGERWRPEVQLPVTCADGSRGYSTELVSGGATRLDFPNLMIVSAAKITGHVYADANQNGTFDGGEQGLAATVLAYRGEQLVQTVQTDEQGAYSLTLTPGSYLICEQLGGEWKQHEAGEETCRDDSRGYQVSLASGTTRIVDFGNEKQGSPGFPWLLAGTGVAVAVLALLGGGWWLRRPRRPGQPAPAAPTTPLAPWPPRTVNTGFAPGNSPGEPLTSDTPLAPNASYVFWLDIGPPVIESRKASAGLSAEYPPRVVVTVALFTLDGFSPPAADVGELELRSDGSVVTVKEPADIRSGTGLEERRLFFPMQTTDRTGTASLRCNIYCEGVLLQSRIVEALVATRGEPVEGALRSGLDFTLAPSLDPARLSQLEPHRLSIFANRSPSGSHDFYFLGEREFKNQASFDGLELQNLIEKARSALRRAAWGDAEPWTEGKCYRYDGFDAERLRADLCRFAIGGYRFYDAIVNRLAGGSERAKEELAPLMRGSGLLQVASRESPRHVVPAALVYDYSLDTGAPLGGYTLCSEFEAALAGNRPLEETRCFTGTDPEHVGKTTVCPGGFWGYRHSVGLPVSVGLGPDAPVEIEYQRGPGLMVAVSTDPNFVLRAAHEDSLKKLGSGVVWTYAATRADTLRILKATKAEIVYFYCHGGLLEDVPYIQVGAPDERGITRDLLRAEGIVWDQPQPLVFINGCHTTALEPEKAIEFVSAFVENAHAAGVIGTEITVFEPLARQFAEECLRRFVNGDSIGESIRGARLALLKAGNPLGLAYIPFVTPSLRLRPAHAGAS